jgi:hypothetical protein
MPRRAYLRRPFAVLDAVRAPRLGSTVRKVLRARRASAPRFGTRNTLKRDRLWQNRSVGRVLEDRISNLATRTRGYEYCTVFLLLLVIPEVDLINFGARQFGETG